MYEGESSHSTGQGESIFHATFIVSDWRTHFEWEDYNKQFSDVDSIPYVRYPAL